MSLFPSILYHFYRFLFVCRMLYVVRFPLSYDGVFLPCDHGLDFSGLRAVTKLPRGVVRERLARRRRKLFRVFPSNGTGKRSRLCTAGWERDGKAGRQKVDGMGWELTISRWDGNSREIKRSGNKSGNRSGNKSGNKLGNKSGNTSGNTSACREAQKSFRGFHHNCCFLCTLYV